MAQLDLFPIRNTNYGKVADPKPLARSSDPATSKAAAEHVSCGLTKHEAAAVVAARELGRAATAAEIAQAACPDNHARRETIRKRVGELTRPAFYKNGDRRRDAWFKTAGERKCDISGKLATAFEVA